MPTATLMAPSVSREEIHVGIRLARWDTGYHNRVSHRIDPPSSVTASAAAAAAAAAAAVAAAATVNPAQPNRSRGRPKQTDDGAAKSHAKKKGRGAAKRSAQRFALKEDGGAEPRNVTLKKKALGPERRRWGRSCDEPRNVTPKKQAQGPNNNTGARCAAHPGVALLGCLVRFF